MKKNSNTLPTPSNTLTDKADKLLDRFLNKLSPQGDCLIYTGARLRNAKGEDTYGIFNVNGKSVLAHRWAYEQFYETTIPDGLVVRHVKCSNPGCCNPFCLAVGSHQDNSNDMVTDGRSTKGRKKPIKRFTQKEKDQIAAYLAAGKSQYWIAKKLNRAESTIGHVVKQIKHPKPRKLRTPKPTPKPQSPQEAFANAA
jgi:hypothetical protein